MFINFLIFAICVAIAGVPTVHWWSDILASRPVMIWYFIIVKPFED